MTLPCLNLHARARLPLLALAAVMTLSLGVSAQLNAVIQQSGQISISVDAEGNNAGTGTIRVEKPLGATVRNAYLLASSSFTTLIANGAVTLNGTGVNWNLTAFNNAGPTNINFFHNVFADVTAIVAPVIDPAPAGINLMTVTESPTNQIEGTILVVIFDDPNADPNTGIILLFGGQATTGDTFVINLAAPLDLTDPNAKAEMGLGISFSFQGNTGTGMVSNIDVNGSRLTSSAGGEDDGGQFNGGLITAGGVGNSTANPANPFGGSTGAGSDDELYNLLGFVNTGDMAITVSTINPTNDDNIFFGYFCTSVPAAIGESILLGPLTSTNPVGTMHTVTATVVNDLNNPIGGRLVNFNVVSGPNAGAAGSGATNVAGMASFTYAGLGGPGVDTIVATMTNSAGMPQTSNTVTKTWVVVGGPTCLPPTPAKELGAGTLTVWCGTLLTYDVVAAGSSTASSGATIVGVTVEAAPFGPTGLCGNYFVLGNLPAGASHNPPLPVSGAPAMTTFSWIPTSNQVGCFRLTYHLVDAFGNTANCTVCIEVVECMLMCGLMPVSLPVSANDVLRVSPLVVLPVLMTSIPGLQIPNLPALNGLRIYTQVMMFNPALFPGDALRLSQGLEYVIGSGASTYGTGSGMYIYAPQPVIHPGDTLTIGFGIN